MANTGKLRPTDNRVYRCVRCGALLEQLVPTNIGGVAASAVLGDRRRARGSGAAGSSAASKNRSG